MTTYDWLDTFKYFLPRLMELYSDHPDSEEHSFTVFLQKLEFGKWQEWEEDEISALQDFCSAWFNSLEGPGVDGYGGTESEVLQAELRDSGLLDSPVRDKAS